MPKKGGEIVGDDEERAGGVEIAQKSTRGKAMTKTLGKIATVTRNEDEDMHLFSIFGTIDAVMQSVRSSPQNPSLRQIQRTFTELPET